MSSQTQQQRRQQLQLEQEHYYSHNNFPESSPISYRRDKKLSKSSEFHHSVRSRTSTLKTTTSTDSNAIITNTAPTSDIMDSTGTVNSKVLVGYSDYLVLNMSSHDINRSRSKQNIRDSDTNPDDIFESDPSSSTNHVTGTATTTKVVSRLTKKLSKHKKPSNDFPADEITEGASTIDVSFIERTDSENEAEVDNSIIHTSTTTTTTPFSRNTDDKNCSIHSDEFRSDEKKTSEIGGNGCINDEMRNNDHDPDIKENIQLLDSSASRTSVSSSDNSENPQIDSNHAVVVAATNHVLNTTSNSSLPTNYTYSTSSPSAPQRDIPPLSGALINTSAIPTSMYNHYDWSYTEETTIATPSTPSSTAQQRRQSHAIRGKSILRSDANHQKFGIMTMDDCDDSILATIASSNTSMDVANTSSTTPDTSFETIIGPVVVAPTKPEIAILSKNKAKKKVTINETQPQGKNRSLTASSSIRSPLEHDTLVIVEDDEKALEFRHTSLILQYASVELAKNLVEYIHEDSDEDSVDELDHDAVRAARSRDDEAIQYMLHVNVQDANDWRSLQPFLEPHAVQPAVVTPYNLPVLLPWFQQLKLNVLLQECDMQLMHHLATPPSSLTSLEQFQRSNNDNNEPFDNDDYLTVWNTVCLGEIAVKAGLERTAKQAFIVASTWLKRFPNVWLQLQPQHHQSTSLLVQALNLLVECLLVPNTNDSVDESQEYSVDESQEFDISFESTDSTTWESMFQPPEASYLFAAMIAYLPIDCVDQQQVNNWKKIRQLITNPLCPFLIREGIQKKQTSEKIEPDVAINQDSDHDIDRKVLNELRLVPVVSSDENVEMIADNETIITENLSPTFPTQQQQMNYNRSSRQENYHHSNSSILQVAEELHAGWNSLWMNLAVAATSTGMNNEKQTQQDREYRNHTMHRALSHPLSDQQSEMALLQSPKELSEWLNFVWDKLCHPPIFSARHSNHSKNMQRELDQPSRIIPPSTSRKNGSGGGSRNTTIVSALRSSNTKPNSNDFTTSQSDDTSTLDYDTTNASSRRTFAC